MDSRVQYLDCLNRRWCASRHIQESAGRHEVTKDPCSLKILHSPDPTPAPCAACALPQGRWLPVHHRCGYHRHPGRLRFPGHEPLSSR